MAESALEKAIQKSIQEKLKNAQLDKENVAPADLQVAALAEQLENTELSQGQKKKLSKGQKKKLREKRKYKRERMQTSADFSLNCSALGAGPSRFDFSKDHSEKLTSRKEKEEFHTKNTHKAGFEKQFDDKKLDKTSKKHFEKMFNRTNWYKKVPKSRREEWVINCYRMRVDDDNRWGGGYMHGIMEVGAGINSPYGLDIKGEQQKKLCIVKDFLKFMILAAQNNTIPTKPGEFNFEELLEIAPPLLTDFFTKESAKRQYGEENVFSNKPSLRRQAEYIYKTSIVQEHNVGKEAMVDYHEVIEDKIEESVDSKNFKNSHASIFASVGGKAGWVKLFSEIDTTRIWNRNDPRIFGKDYVEYPSHEWAAWEKNPMIENITPDDLNENCKMQ